MSDEEIKQRLRKLEQQVAALKKCIHEWDGPFFNMCNAYKQCRKCGKRVSI